jgi:multiple sugar transport system permease protein
MLLAALQNIPDDLYEAAALDGATMWQQFRRITLPMVRAANVVVLLVMGLWTFNEFNVPYLLFGQAPPNQARLLSMHIYVNSFVNWNLGLGAAMSVLLLLALMAASLLYLRIVVGGRTQHA